MSFAIDKYFGKTNRLGEFSITQHSLDTATLGKMWLTHNPFFLNRCVIHSGKEPSVLLGQILFQLYLHDTGKISWRFQRYNPELWKKTFMIEDGAMVAGDLFYDHGICDDPEYDASNIFLKELNPFVDESDYIEDDESWELWLKWTRASASHHDRYGIHRGVNVKHLRFRNDSMRIRETIEDVDRNARQEFFDLGKKLFLEKNTIDKSCNYIPRTFPSAFFRGFCCVCDWIASNEQYLEKIGRKDSTEPASEYCSRIEPICVDILRSFGLIREVLHRKGFGEIFPTLTPRGIQKIVPARLENRLFISESSTGSGKTEFALSLALEILAGGDADSIIFALPTQATANSMFNRIKAAAERIFPSGGNMILSHGKAKYYDKFLELIGETTSEDGMMRCSLWLSDSKKRSLLGQICICTLDQVLIGSLPVKHAFVRSFAVGRSVLIIDEVHSYSHHMNGLLHGVLTEQSQIGGTAILLSATLPERRKKQLAIAWQGKGKKDADAYIRKGYPLVTVIPGQTCPRDDTVDFYEPDESEKKKSVRLESVRISKALPDEKMYLRIIEAAKSGKCVAFIANLVDDAHCIYNELSRRVNGSIPVDIFHSRYLPCDRAAKESQILEDYGEHRVPGKGRIIVATQVIEQSLNLDFDLMFSQICPVDLLFQRIGRLYRFDIQRMDDDLPLCVVLSPVDNDFVGHAFVYGHLEGFKTSMSLLWRTRHLVENCGGKVVFPDIYRDWVDKVYAETFDGEAPVSAEQHKQLDLCGCGKEIAARQWKNIDRRFLDSDERVGVMTRDGEQSLQVVLKASENTFMDGTPFSKEMLEDMTNIDAVSKNTVCVPGSGKWHERLSVCEMVSGCYIIDIEGLKTCSLRYSKEKGLEIEK